MGLFGWDPIEDTKKAISDAGNTVNAVSSGLANSVNRELSNAGNSINSGLYQATGGASAEDVALNFLTGGLIGYGDNGLQPGMITRGLREGIGELTGANALRDANNQARNLLEEQRREAERLRQEELARRRVNDISASRAAGRAQRQNLFAASSGLGAEVGAFNNLTRDFLGL